MKLPLRFAFCSVLTVTAMVLMYAGYVRGFDMSDVISQGLLWFLVALNWITWFISDPIAKDVYSEDGFLLGYRIIYPMNRTNIRKISKFYNKAVDEGETIYLSPMHTNFSWKSGWNEATDWNRGFPHGLYAFKKTGKYLKKLMEHRFSIIVEVELAGEIAIHENGYRAQYAKVVKVMGHAYPQSNVQQIDASKFFGCDFKREDEYEKTEMVE